MNILSYKHTGQVLTAGPVAQFLGDGIPSKTIEEQRKPLTKTRKLIRNRSFHGPWPWGGGGPVPDRCLYKCKAGFKVVWWRCKGAYANARNLATASRVHRVQRIRQQTCVLEFMPRIHVVVYRKELQRDRSAPQAIVHELNTLSSFPMPF